MIGEHGKEDVGVHAALDLMEDGSHGERALDVSKGVFDPGEQGVGVPDLFRIEVRAIGLEQVAAVERLGASLGIELPGEALALRGR